MIRDCIQTGPNTFVEGVPEIWRNFLRGFNIWKNWYLALRNLFWPLGCVKNAKKSKIMKNQVFEGILAISPQRLSQFLWFFGTRHLRPIANSWKKIFPKTCFIFEKKLPLQKVIFLKNLFFYFQKIQNLSSQRPKLSAPRSSGTRSDLFGQGEHFSRNFCIFLMKEGLNQKIALRK